MVHLLQLSHNKFAMNGAWVGIESALHNTMSGDITWLASCLFSVRYYALLPGDSLMEWSSRVGITVYGGHSAKQNAYSPLGHCGLTPNNKQLRAKTFPNSLFRELTSNNKQTNKQRAPHLLCCFHSSNFTSSMLRYWVILPPLFRSKWSLGWTHTHVGTMVKVPKSI